MFKLSSHRSYNWIEAFSFQDDFWQENGQTIDPCIDLNGKTHVNFLEEFSIKNNDNLKVLHLNINSLISKMESFYEILDTDKYDILFINESQLNTSTPDTFISHRKYACY